MERFSSTGQRICTLHCKVQWRSLAACKGWGCSGTAAIGDRDAARGTSAPASKWEVVWFEGVDEPRDPPASSDCYFSASSFGCCFDSVDLFLAPSDTHVSLLRLSPESHRRTALPRSCIPPVHDAFVPCSSGCCCYTLWLFS